MAPKRTIGLVAAGVVALGAGVWVASNWGIETTDNAQLQAHLYRVASRLPGTVAQVLVEALQLMLQQQGVDPELASRRALEIVDQLIDRQAALLAYGDVFHLLALVFLAAIPLVLLLRAPRRGRA